MRWVGDVLQITTPESDRNVETEGLLLLRLLGHFTQPSSAHEIAPRFPKQSPAEILRAVEELRLAGVLIDAEREAASPDRSRPRDGDLTMPVMQAIGQPVTLPQLTQRPGPGVAIIGAPSDLGASGEGGAQHGPVLIRGHFPARSFFAGGPRADAPFLTRTAHDVAPTAILDIDGGRRFPASALSVVDLGNVVLKIGEGLQPFGERLQAVVRAALQAGRVPIVLGGDHSVSWYPLQLIAQQHGPFGILHFDAHTDLYDGLDAGRLTHANFLVKLLDLGALRHVHQVGLRGFQPVAAAQRTVDDARITHVSARALRRLSPAQVFAGLPRDIPYYLTFDIDCLSPQLAGETGTPVIGGVDYYDALDLIDYAGRNFRIVGADFVEVALRSAAHNWAARAAGSLLMQLLLTFLPPQPMGSYFLKGLDE